MKKFLIIFLALFSISGTTAKTDSDISSKTEVINELYIIAGKYLYGWEEKMDYSKALEYFYKILEIGGDDEIGALFRIGYIYEYGGYGVIQDLNKAKDYYQKAANLGDAKAMNNLAGMYLDGRGVEQDFPIALDLYIKAAAKGETFALYNIGMMTEYGLGISQDYSEAFRWYKRAAESNIAESMIRVALFYYNGVGVEQDYTASFEWMKKASGKGNLKARQLLGLLYERGEGVAQNYEAAMMCYKSAAEKNYSPAMCSLGLLYYKGLGVQQDFYTAFDYFYKAATNECIEYGEAMKWLSECYRFGHGVTKDLTKADYWLKKAQEMGNDSANKIKQLLLRKE